MVERTCLHCGTVFEKPEYDVVHRGWGRFCSLSCTAKGTNTAKHQKGERLSQSRANVVARALWIQRHGCQPVCWCGSPADIHHKNGDVHNNDESNHEPLCRSHHTALENRLKPRRKKGVRADGKHSTWSRDETRCNCPACIGIRAASAKRATQRYNEKRRAQKS